MEVEIVNKPGPMTEAKKNFILKKLVELIQSGNIMFKEHAKDTQVL